jgi:D-beta-D-heptose 7-phosphate kinase/D-beta-D-heptose 1-phosphate adenosyltransferase
MKKLVLVTGGFDPLHSGHIAYFKEAKKLGDTLVVGVNSDAWLIRKKGRSFMPFSERTNIVKNIQGVDFVIEFNDDDNSAKQAIKLARQTWPEHQIIFANGGDRTNTNIPEMGTGIENVEFVFGVGGENKMNSSSWILQEWKAPKTERQWGYYRVLHENNKEVKLKELTVLPGEKLSMQRHTDRAEHWFVAEGIATVYTINISTDVELLGDFKKFDHIHINRTQWHQLCNETAHPLKIVEIQYGERCEEEDIERK